MSDGTVRLRIALILVAGFVIHAAISGSLAIRGARPDIAVTFLLVCCLFVDSSAAALFGMSIGILEASYANSFVGSIIVSRTITCWMVGLLEERIFRDSVLIAVAVGFLGTFVMDGMFFLFAPQPHALRWIIRTSEAALYNSALSAPIYLLVRPLLRRKQ